MSNTEPSRPADHVRPLAAYLVRNGAWLIPLAAYALAWSLWIPLLGRDMGSAVGRYVRFTMTDARDRDKSWFWPVVMEFQVHGMPVGK